MAHQSLSITSLGFQGDGISAEGIFVPLTLPGEVVQADVHKDRADLLDIITASPDRTDPVCRHFSRCGGCALQHWEINAYSAWKRDLVISLLSKAGLETQIDPILTTPPHSRRRVGLHAKRINGPKGAFRVELGFKMRKSWDQVRIEECPVADPRIVAALPSLTELAKALFEHPKSAPILNVTVSETGLDIDIRGVERSKSGGLSADGRMQIAMTASAADFARVTLSDEIQYMARAPQVRFGRAIVDLPFGPFLQASPKSEADMVRLVTQAVAGAKKVADLFCGSGTFTFPLAEQAVVYAADGAAGAVGALKSAMGRVSGLKTITAEVRDLYRRPMLAAEMNGFDAIVFDPPRAGAEDQAREIALSAVKRVVAVSCNPQTFIRDVRILTEAGFSLDKVTPIDQFLWSGHVELVGVLSR
ncbi:class I SAM-dependent RNA methyltransferase [Asticcacaulis sp. SL142]|uniref:class I SAM-dependent RNA methyltransferase n=1 Tax=Asticcacaulis sp. SL142 TaxID=2995155 RepID=UPI00226CD790|nr:class I SAM-dependent RNA methyltransferase [Asticcacaulis sp. SL142]WAC49041.1 class I SAM-dependent RNA methyltransferase [Asticcacaulis sp. SL142]